MLEIMTTNPTDEARAQITRIKKYWQGFWYELRDFHERQGWLELGYTSFRSCVEQELGMSERRAYSIVSAADIRQELITADIGNLDAMGTDQALELKPLSAPLRVEVARQVDFSLTTVRELRQIVKEAKATLEIKVEEAKAARPVVASVVPRRLPDGIVIEVGDCADLHPLPDNSIDLICTSPPYGLAVDYGSPDDPADWDELMVAWLTEMFRVIRPGGRLALNVPLDTTLGGWRPTFALAVDHADRAGWKYRSSIVWAEGNVSRQVARGSVDSPSSPAVIAPVEMIGLFSKGAWGVGWQPDGRPDTDLTHEEWLEWTSGLWTFGGETRAWEGHPAPFPEELPRRLIKLLSYPGDVVLDPFGGSFTTAAVAYRLGRRFFGFDLSHDFVDSGRRRIAAEG